MRFRRRSPLREAPVTPFRPFAFAAWLGLAVVGLTLLPSPGASNEPRREEEISAIEQQIAELQKKLEALKKAPAPAPKPSHLTSLPAEWTKSLSWRCIGPASMGGRIVAFAVNPSDPSMYWIATASGGLLKTTNNGVTFEHQFDREATVSIGDVAVSASDPKVVWVGTGEHNPRNSVSYGDGVYKSTDGGKSWKNMGLKKTFQVGRIVIHPTNPDVVYVGALGRLYGPNEDRGLYKTSDGGKTWSKILHVDNNTGVIEMKMHPTSPDTLLVATWERRRNGFDSHAGAIAGEFNPVAKVEPPMEDGYDAYDPIKKWGKGSGLWKTTDGGKTFKRLTKGLPTCEMGRIGLDYYLKNPIIVFAIIDTAKIGGGRVPGYLGVTSDDAENGTGAKIASGTENAPAAEVGLKAGDVVTAVDKTPIKKSDDFSDAIGKHKPGDTVTLTLLRAGKTLTLTATLTEPADLAPPRQTLDFKTEEVAGGVAVRALAPGGSSAQAGLQVGDVITQLDKQKVTQAKQLLDAFRAAKPGNKVSLTVQRGKETKQVAVVVPERAFRRRTNRP